MAEQIEFSWCNCPHCHQKLFKYDPKKVFHISIACPHCQAVYEIETKTDGAISFKQTRDPKRSFVPRYNKNSL